MQDAIDEHQNVFRFVRLDTCMSIEEPIINAKQYALQSICMDFIPECRRYLTEASTVRLYMTAHPAYVSLADVYILREVRHLIHIANDTDFLCGYLSSEYDKVITKPLFEPATEVAGTSRFVMTDNGASSAFCMRLS